MKTLRETILKHSWQEDMVGPDLVRVDDAIDALRQWLADEGLVVVPREFTDDMTDAIQDSPAGGNLAYARQAWGELIAAAPDALREGE